MTRLTYSFLGRLRDAEVFEPFYIGTPITLPQWAVGVTDSIIDGTAVVAKSLHTPCGLVTIDDVVWLRAPTRLAKVRLAVRVGTSICNHRYYVIVDIYNVTDAGVWTCDVKEVLVCNAAQISNLCCHLVVGDRIFV